MSLLKYFKPVVPEKSTLLSTQELRKIDESVKRVREKEEKETIAKKRKIGQHNKYSAELRASIGKYAAENGATRAAVCFSKKLEMTINESTARKFKDDYIRELSVTKDRVKLDGKTDSIAPILALPTRQQGRPLLLGKELDDKVQQFIITTRANKGVINTSIVMGAAEVIIAANDSSKLLRNGGHIMITKAWVKSLFKRMHFVKRKCSNAGKVPVSQFDEIKEVFLADVRAEVLMNDIPSSLIFNWDQTPLHLVPTGQWTMNKEKEKVISIAHSDDKRQITATLAVTLTGEYLPPQLIFQGKTTRCHPRVDVPEGWDLWHSPNHWANEETMTRYLHRVIIPFVNRKRGELGVSNTQPALAIFDCFKGQTTDLILQTLKKNNIVSVIVPANCTDKLQPIDLSINKPIKDGLRSSFQSWYANEIQKQIKDDPQLQHVKVDLSAPAVKTSSTKWLISLWESIIKGKPEMAINGFKKAGIYDAVTSVQE